MARTGAVKAGEAFVELFSDDSPLVRSMKGLGAKLQKTTGGIASIGNAAASAGARITVLGGGIAAALGFPLKLAANMENAEASFTTLLKSGDAAKKLLKELQDFAAETPFQFDELADAGKKLLAFGSEARNVQSELRRIGDIASAIGAPIGEIAEIYGKARVQGRLFAEDINQLTGRGIPVIQELAKQFGVSDQQVKKLVEDGQVGFENLEKAFISLTSAGGKFAGGMKRQSETLTGAFSTLKDNIIAAFRPFGEELLPAAKAAVQVATAGVRRFAEWARANKELVIPLATAAVSLVAMGAGLASMGKLIAGISTSIGFLGTVLTTLGTAIGAISAPVVAVVAGVAALGAGIAYVASQAGLLAPAFEFLRTSFGRIYETFMQTFGGIVNALKGGEFGLAAQIAWAGVKLATLQGTQQVLVGVEYLWSHAGAITAKFFGALGKLVYNAFAAIPKIALAALRGGAALAEVMQGILAGAFTNANMAAALEPMIARAQAELDSRLSQRVAQAGSRPRSPMQRQAPDMVPPSLQGRPIGPPMAMQAPPQSVGAPRPPAEPRPSGGGSGPEFGVLVALARRQVQLLGQIAAQGGLA